MGGVDRRLHLVVLEHFPADVDFQGRVRRVWPNHRPPQVLLSEVCLIVYAPCRMDIFGAFRFFFSFSSHWRMTSVGESVPSKMQVNSAARRRCCAAASRSPRDASS